MPHGLLGWTPLAFALPVAVWVALEIIWRGLARKEVRFRTFITFELAAVSAAMIGAKLFSLIERDWVVESLVHEIAAGWRYPGALLMLMAFVPAFLPRFFPCISLPAFGDLAVVGLAFAGATIRISCLLQGCCTGAVCASGMCVPHSAGSAVWHAHVASGLIPSDALSSAPVLPLYALFALAALLTGAVLLWWEPRKHYNGQLVLVYLALHEGLKFALEFLRDPPAPLVQTTSMVLAIGACVALMVLSRRGRHSDARVQQFTQEGA